MGSCVLSMLKLELCSKYVEAVFVCSMLELFCVVNMLKLYCVVSMLKLNCGSKYVEAGGGFLKYGPSLTSTAFLVCDTDFLTPT